MHAIIRSSLVTLLAQLIGPAHLAQTQACVEGPVPVVVTESFTNGVTSTDNTTIVVWSPTGAAPWGSGSNATLAGLLFSAPPHFFQSGALGGTSTFSGLDLSV